MAPRTIRSAKMASTSEMLMPSPATNTENQAVVLNEAR